MTADNLFQITNIVAMLGWLLLIVAPHWKYTKSVVQIGLIPILLSVVYAYLIASNWGSTEGGFGSLQEVQQLFSNPHLLLAGWIHYLAFDLWLGSWEVGDAKKNQIPHIMVVPCLVFTFFFGPVGLLMYILLRWIKTKKFLSHENF